MRAATSVAIVVGGAVATALSVPPFGWWPLGPVGLALLATTWWDAPTRGRRAALGFLWAVVQLGIGSFWIIEFQAVGLVVLVAMMSAFWAMAGALAPRSGAARALAFAGAAAGAEALRSRIPFGGFPMSGIALGQADSPLTPLARLGGTSLLILVTCAVGAALAEAIRRRWQVAFAVAVPALAVVAVAGPLPDGTIVGGPLRFAAVQGGGERGTRALETPPDLVLVRHLEASRQIRPGQVDVVLWPENSVNAEGVFAGSIAEQALSAEAQRLRAFLLVGVVEDAGPGRFKNAEIAFGPDGTVVGRYDKVHRVPFGEYAPLRSFVAQLASLQLLPSDAIPGTSPGLLPGPAGSKLGVTISYEVFYGDRARAAMSAGAEVLLVPTNASSYKTAQVPDQEIAAARLRAWETGRDVIQAAPTGFSARIDTTGNVFDRSTLGARAVLVESLPRRVGRTPYQRSGDLPWLLLTAVCAVAPALVARVRRSRS